MSDDRYPLQETNRDEEFLFFSGNTEDQACIGHLRGDFGGGTEFWATWWDHNEELKGQEFKDELDAVVNALRKDGPLKNLSSMERYCRSHAQARMSPASGTDYYGFRVDTEKYRYYLRFLPRQGDYNFYIYCYQTDKFERAAELPPRENDTNSQTIKVLVVEPMKPCEVREISSLDDMQKIVGGNIEAVYPFTDPVAVVCNAEGKNLDLPYNRPLCDRSGIPYDIHLTEKPLQLMRDIVKITEPGGHILDPFAGSGTTILAAVLEGYTATGFEVTDEYARLARERIERELAEAA